MDDIYAIFKDDIHCNNAYYTSLEKAGDAIKHHCSLWFEQRESYVIKRFKLVENEVSYAVV
jgi:hypothetical protein